jgi:hypothetical protein
MLSIGPTDAWPVTFDCVLLRSKVGDWSRQSIGRSISQARPLAMHRLVQQNWILRRALDGELQAESHLFDELVPKDRTRKDSDCNWQRAIEQREYLERGPYCDTCLKAKGQSPHIRSNSQASAVR